MLPVSIQIGSCDSCSQEPAISRNQRHIPEGEPRQAADILAGPRAGRDRTSPADAGTESAGSGSLEVIQRGLRRITDRVELSRDATSGGDVRHDLVARVRAQIAAGEYDSPAKIEAAADRLARRLDLLA